MSASAKIRILRFDPSVDVEPYYKDYEVTDFDTSVGPLSVLKALHWINLHIEPIGYDYNCRRTTCGLCGMMINGEPRLACMTAINDGDEVTLEPMAGFPVIRDLIVDTSSAKEQFVNTNVSLKTSSPDAVCQRYDDPEKYWVEISHHNACRECMLCYTTCMALRDLKKWDTFIGPGAMHQIYLRHIDGIDEADRLAQAVQSGVFECVQCGKCSQVCPAHIPICENNKTLMDEAEARGLKPTAEATSYWPMR